MPEKDGSWLLGVVVCSKTGTCLVNACSDAPLRVRELCRMLPALHSLAAGVASPTSHLDLSTCSVALCESRVGYIVAALTSPGADWRQRRASASFVAETVSRAFAWHGGEHLESFIARDMDDAVMDATADAGKDADDGDDDDATTHPQFRSFDVEFLRPALAREFARPAHVRWLEPLVGCVTARVAHAHVLIPRSRDDDDAHGSDHRPATNDDVAAMVSDDREFDHGVLSDAIRAEELRARDVGVSRRGVRAGDRGVEPAREAVRRRRGGVRRDLAGDAGAVFGDGRVEGEAVRGGGRGRGPTATASASGHRRVRRRG